ncbi:MAG: deaminase [Candidatus Yanofskybacteria bacterium]|nr:deaminase [Candidatus Yanofskybacteria bacterium]
MDRRDLKPDAVVAYVPVLHAGYRRLFDRYPEAAIYIFGQQLVEESDYLHKEIRALDPKHVKLALQIWYPQRQVEIAYPDLLRRLAAHQSCIVLPNEDVCQQVANRYLTGCRQVEFDSIFLRWDRTNTLEQHEAQFDRSILVTELDRELIGLAFKESEKSSDWWRQVGGVLVRNGQVLVMAYNQHLPSPHTPYADGDPRNAFRKGVNIELGTVLHAEKAIICEAARRPDISTDGTYLYVSTFPCPPCAKAVAAAGIKRCYYSSGYAMLNGERDLKAGGVEVVYVHCK